MNEAALEAVRRGGEVVTSADVYNGMDRILQARPLARAQPETLVGLGYAALAQVEITCSVEQCIKMQSCGSWCGDSQQS
jgi:hypothetical protein